MTGEGIERLCLELDLDASADVRALVLAWKLKSGEKPGAIRKSEFVAGMQTLRCDSVAELNDMLDDMVAEQVKPIHH